LGIIDSSKPLQPIGRPNTLVRWRRFAVASGSLTSKGVITSFFSHGETSADPTVKVSSELVPKDEGGRDVAVSVEDVATDGVSGGVVGAAIDAGSTVACAASFFLIALSNIPLILTQVSVSRGNSQTPKTTPRTNALVAIANDLLSR